MMVAHRLLSSAMRSNDDNDWSAHSLMLSLRDLRGPHPRQLPSTVPWSVILDRIWWRQTWPNHDYLRRLTVDDKSFWRPGRTLTCCHTYSNCPRSMNVVRFYGLFECICNYWVQHVVRSHGRVTGSKIAPFDFPNIQHVEWPIMVKMGGVSN